MAEEIDLQLNEEESESPEALITLPDGRELYEHFHFTADRGQKPLRIDKYLVTRMERTSRNRIQQAADAGCIIVNGRAVKSSYQVKPDDEISICMDRPRYDFEIVPEDIPLDVVYEDASVLVGEPSAEEITTELQLTGRRLAYTLAIPKGDAHDWNDVQVAFFGQHFRTCGGVVQGIERMIPLCWNKKVQVVRDE